MNSISSNPFSALSDSLAEVVERVAPSTLALRGRGRRAQATAVVWQTGIAVTAAHVLRHSPAALTLTAAGGHSVDASVVGTDSSTDIAVLRLADDRAAPVSLGDAAAVKAGHLVLAVGCGTDGEPNASYGLVSRASGPWQTWLGGQIDRLIRLDGGLYEGLSGAPVADSRGQVIGMASSALSRSCGIVVPAATVTRVVDQLLRQGHVARAFIGIAAQPVALPGDQGGSGLLVSALVPDGAAQRAGLMVGDIIVRAAGSPVASLAGMRAALAGSVGQTVEFGVLRGGVATPLNVLVGEWPSRRRGC